jgi:tRNA(Ile)-lysidine synthase TilS/MesJ
MRICSRCVLPETFPGITFGRGGVCNFCRESDRRESRPGRDDHFGEKLGRLIRETKGRGAYDALMSYSGGKDSTYVLSMVRRVFGLRVLALTFDNGFIPDVTLANIRNVVDRLGVDHLLFRPRFDILRRVFLACAAGDIFPRTALARASSICTACMAIVKFTGLRLALEKDIPLVFFGWSPGQIPLSSSIIKLNSMIVRPMQEVVLGPLERAVGQEIRELFLDKSQLGEGSSFPYIISPLAFLEYDEKRIFGHARRLGWKIPPGVDANSTNCTLNSFAIAVHQDRLKFHPYAPELAKLVRTGRLSRGEALARLTRPVDVSTIDGVKKRLGIDVSS